MGKITDKSISLQTWWPWKKWREMIETRTFHMKNVLKRLSVMVKYIVLAFQKIFLIEIEKKNTLYETTFYLWKTLKEKNGQVTGLVIDHVHAMCMPHPYTYMTVSVFCRQLYIWHMLHHQSWCLVCQLSSQCMPLAQDVCPPQLALGA